MKYLLMSLAACAALAASPLPAFAQHIIQVPSAAEQRESVPPQDERVLEEFGTAPGCWISSVEVDGPSGPRTVTRQVCH